MKFPRLLLGAVLLTSPGCDQARTLVSRIGKSAGTGKTTAVNGTPHVRNLSDGEADSFALQRGKLAILEFHADWNGQSRQLAPVLESLTVEYGGVVVVGKVNFDRLRALAAREGVKSVPDVRIYRDGSLVDKFVGLPDESEIRAKIAKYAKGLPTRGEGGKVAAVTKPTAEPMRKDWMPPGMRRR